MKVYECTQHWVDAVMSRDGYHCQICGAFEAEGAKLWARRLIPKSRNGPLALSNGLTLCKECNRCMPEAGPKLRGKPYQYTVTEYLKCPGICSGKCAEKREKGGSA